MIYIFKKRVKEMAVIIILFLVLSVVIVQLFTKTLWTAETNLKLDNNLLNPFNFNTLSPNVSNMVQGLYSNITALDLNKEYLEMVALNPPFIDYVTSRYGEDERFGVFIEPKASKSNINYVVVKSVADSQTAAQNMLNEYLKSLNNQVISDLKSKSKAAQKLLDDLLLERSKFEKTTLTSSEQEQLSQISAAINFIKWVNVHYNNIVDLKSAIYQYGKVKVYESAGSKFEKALRIVAGMLAGVIVAILYVIYRERKYIIQNL